MPGPGNRMRSSRGHGRNMNSNQGPSGQAFGSSGMLAPSGPLMTNHLQLHDLDLELALLKRKREMIEKQHTMLVSESRFGGGSSQYSFNEAPQSYGQRSEQTRNFSSFYNDGPGPKYDRFTTQQGVKRPVIDPWDNSAPKRFNAPPAPKRASRYEPRPARSQPASQPPPLMSSSFRQRRPAPMSSRNNFKPSKVTKPKQNTAPNKLDSLPVAERKNLVNSASGLVQKTPEAFIYVPDKPAHPKLLGRLELALGNILREMREKYGDVEPHNTTFAHALGQRTIKQTIRERIRTIMLGKPVGAAAEVVDLYRKEHPKDTDVELLIKAREFVVQPCEGNLAIEIIKQGNPERYFRNNFRRLLSFSLDEMFDRVQKLYNTVDTSGKPLQEVINSLLVDVEKSMLETKEEEPTDVSENITENVDDQPAEKTEMNTSEVNKSDENGAEVDTNATPEEASVQPDENAAKSGEKPAETDEKAAESGEKAVESDEKSPDSKENVENPGENTAEPGQNGDTPVKNAGTVKRGSQSSPEYVRARFYNRLMETMLKRNLPIVLPKYKDFLMRIMNTENAFRETKAFLIKSTNERVDEIANKKAASLTKNPAGSEKRQLFVKVMGRPVLPKKKLMKTFLDDFHPTLIKKHRNMHNILFVSFDNKENFENILAKNGTVISSCKLDIKVSEKINRNKPNEAEKPNGDTQEGKSNEGDVETVEPKSDSIMDGDIDEQISDLLSTIRDEEGKDDGSKKEGDESEVKIEEPANNEVEVKKEEPANNEGETQDSQNTEQVSESEKMEDEPEKKNENEETQEVGAVQVEAVKNETAAKATPTRSSARLTSTPSAVRTRRASKLAQ